MTIRGWLKQKLKELRCDHDYERVNRMVMDNYIYKCTKCGKTIHIPYKGHYLNYFASPLPTRRGFAIF